MTEEITEEKSTDSPISSELADEIRERNLDNKADFVFVDNVSEVTDDIVEIEFETPFHGETMSMQFSKPGTDVESVPDLEELYTRVEADILNPESIMDVSIPIDLDIIEDQNFREDSEDWVPEESLKWKTKDRNIWNWVDGLGGLSLAVLSAILIIPVGGWATLLGFLSFCFIGMASYLVIKRQNARPEDTKIIVDESQVSEGSVIVLEKESDPYKRKERTACRVVENMSGDGFEVTTQDGETGHLWYDPASSAWVLEYYYRGSDKLGGEFEVAHVLSDDYDRPDDIESDSPDGFSESLREDIRSRKLSSEADYMYVDSIEESDEKTVEVKFEEPFRDETISVDFTKPDYQVKRTPDLEELYDEVNADLSQPDSVIGREIDRDLEIINNRSSIDTDITSIMSKQDVRHQKRAISAVLMILAVATGAMTASSTLLGFLASVTIFGIFYILSVGTYIHDLNEIDDSKEISEKSTLSKGDIVVLDERYDKAPTDMTGREVCKVVSYTGRVKLRDGGKARIDYNDRDNEWTVKRLESGRMQDADTYEVAYQLTHE